MKVRCKNIYNHITKEFQETSRQLTIGKEYTVLEVEIYFSNKIWYRLVGDNKEKMPALYEASQFDLILGDIPSSWQIIQVGGDGLTIGPKAWQKEGFWEQCYDYDPAALEIYRREVQKIYEEENKL